jgi:hypothetical protein
LDTFVSRPGSVPIPLIKPACAALAAIPGFVETQLVPSVGHPIAGAMDGSHNQSPPALG